jgi:hypothetical protein
MLVIMSFLNQQQQNGFSNTVMAQYTENNIYSYQDEDMYSKYPTDLNKYECRTGPFEGFFISSVEFCKHIKFDKDNDRKDNRTGTQGPPGRQGPPGIQDPEDWSN